MMTISLSFGIAYLYYRLLYTISFSHLIFWALFIFAEIQGYLNYFLFCFDTWSPSFPEPQPPQPGLSVDILICTYNEETDLLRKTILGCEAIDYPHTTYLLDDGHRDNVKQLAQMLGIQYISRTDNINAKAGNLNNALQHITGDFLVVLDADHVPLPDFLNKTLGYFNDPKVAFVQTPQTYYNLDALEEAVDMEKGWLREQAEIFFHLIMPGKNRWNSAYFCGTGTVFRRQAIDQVGGFSTKTITEDIETSIKIHSFGWKSVYTAEHLSSGLAPEDMFSYHSQRSRWAIGNLRTFLCCNPLTIKGLTLPQRLSYLNSIFFWLNGIRKMIFYITPLIILIFGIYPVEPISDILLLLFITNILLLLTTYKVTTYGRGSYVYEEFYHMITFWIFTSSFFRAYLNIKPHKFITTNKSGEQRYPFASIIPQIIFVSITIFAIVCGITKLQYDIDSNIIGIAISLFWCLWNIFFALKVIMLSAAYSSTTKEMDYYDYIPVLYKDNNLQEQTAITKEYGNDGFTAYFEEKLDLDSVINVVLILRTFRLSVKVKIVKQISTESDKLYCYKCCFEQIDNACLDMLNIHTMLYTVPRLLDHLNKKGKALIKNEMATPFFGALENYRTDFPVNLNNRKNDWSHCRTESITRTGIDVLTEHKLQEEEIMHIAIATPQGKIMFVGQAIENKPFFFHGTQLWKSYIAINIIDTSSAEIIEELACAC